MFEVSFIIHFPFPQASLFQSVVLVPLLVSMGSLDIFYSLNLKSSSSQQFVFPSLIRVEDSSNDGIRIGSMDTILAANFSFVAPRLEVTTRLDVENINMQELSMPKLVRIKSFSLAVRTSPLNLFFFLFTKIL